LINEVPRASDPGLRPFHNFWAAASPVTKNNIIDLACKETDDILKTKEICENGIREAWIAVCEIRLEKLILVRTLLILWMDIY